jgi:hypothetical protein
VLQSKESSHCQARVVDADGAGWWDEGGVGVDAEAVGSASVWEGLGSMSFGGML